MTHTFTTTITSPDETCEYTLVIEYDVSPPERQTRDYPGSPATLEVNSVRCVRVDGLYGVHGPWITEHDEADAQIAVGTVIRTWAEDQIVEACWENANELSERE